MDEVLWDEVREAWGEYTRAVEDWLSEASDLGDDPGVGDELIHQVIQTHNAWSARLEAVLQAVHHH